MSRRVAGGRPQRRRLLWAAAALVASALLAAGCGSQVDGDPGEATDALRVGALEYEFATSHAAVHPGELQIELTNAGAEAHDLRVEARGAVAQLAPLSAGDSATLTVDVPEGADELVLWCTLPGHRRQGMETTLQVTAP